MNQKDTKQEFTILLPDVKTVDHDDLNMDEFRTLGRVLAYDMTDEKELAQRIVNADAIICNKTLMNENTLKDAKRLKYIGLFATGYNNVDLEYTKKRGITVCNAGQYSTHAVAQHTFALILNHFNRIQEYSRFSEEGRWIGLSTFCPLIYEMQELAGKTIGIIGYGSIGREVAKIAKAFSMHVLVYSRTKKEDEGIVNVSLSELAQKSDIITVHCPLNAQSEKMCNEAFFAECKEGAYFVNTSRGGVVDEIALRNAVLFGKLSGAGVDVITEEPMKQDCPLYQVPNITITPHIAWAPRETRQRVVDIACGNLKNYLAGVPTNVVS